MNKQHNQIKESEQEVKIISEIKKDEEVLKFEQALKEDKLALVKNETSGGAIKKSGDKISLALVIILLLLSVIQSVELFNLQAQIAKGQFNAAASRPAAGGIQGLPSQQGGC